MTIERAGRGLLQGSPALARLFLALTGMAAMAGAARATDDLALPTGGSAAIIHREPRRLGVRQHSNRTVIDWESFDKGGVARSRGGEAATHSDSATGVVVVDFNRNLSPLLKALRVALDLSILSHADEEEDAPLN